MKYLKYLGAVAVSALTVSSASAFTIGYSSPNFDDNYQTIMREAAKAHAEQLGHDHGMIAVLATNHGIHLVFHRFFASCKNRGQFAIVAVSDQFDFLPREAFLGQRYRRLHAAHYGGDGAVIFLAKLKHDPELDRSGGVGESRRGTGQRQKERT